MKKVYYQRNNIWKKARYTDKKAILKEKILIKI